MDHMLLINRQFTTRDAYADLNLEAVVAGFSGRLKDFFTLKKFFPSDCDAAMYFQGVCWEAQEQLAHEQDIDLLREMFRRRQQDKRFNHNSAKVTAHLADDIYDLLKSVKHGYPDDSDRPLSLLDIGCGSGIITSTLAGRFGLDDRHAVGLDLVVPPFIPDNISIRQITQDDIMEAVRGEQYDATIISMVLHHSAHPEKLLRQAWQATRPGGYLVLKEHDAPPEIRDFLDAVHFFHEEIFQDKVYFKPNARNYRTRGAWERLAHRIGFVIEAIQYHGYDEDHANTGNNFTLLLRKVG